MLSHSPNPKPGRRHGKICISAWVSDEVNIALEEMAAAQERTKSFVLKKILLRGVSHRMKAATKKAKEVRNA